MNILLCLAASFVLLGQNALEPPPELAFLKESIDSESVLVDAMRKYDMEQTALAAQQLAEAKYLEKAGQSELAQQKSAEAQQLLERIKAGYEYVIANYRNSARAHTYYGELLYDYLGEMDGAIRAWQLANSLEPKYARPLNNLGLHYCHTGQYEQGLAALDEALELEPNNPDYLYNLAQVYLVNFPQVQTLRKWSKEKVYAQAMKLSKKAVENDPEDFDLLQDYAVNFFAAEQVFNIKPDWKKAAKAWQEARPHARNDAETFYTWLNEGRVWLRDGNKTKAAECFTRSLELKPDSTVAKQLLDQAQGASKEPPQKPEAQKKAKPKSNIKVPVA